MHLQDSYALLLFLMLYQTRWCVPALPGQTTASVTWEHVICDLIFCLMLWVFAGNWMSIKESAPLQPQFTTRTNFGAPKDKVQSNPFQGSTLQCWWLSGVKFGGSDSLFSHLSLRREYIWRLFTFQKALMKCCARVKCVPCQAAYSRQTEESSHLH